MQTQKKAKNELWEPPSFMSLLTGETFSEAAHEIEAKGAVHERREGRIARAVKAPQHKQTHITWDGEG
jgi:hypothetical protein